MSPPAATDSAAPRLPLREGFTTGSAATAASVAALRLLLDGLALTEADIPVPPGARISRRLSIPIASVTRLDAHTALGAVIKDGGDDPDATHQARIEAVIRLDAENPADPADPEDAGDEARAPERTVIHIDGGPGVGRATLPGLPVQVGQAAINPATRAQIALALEELMASRDLSGCVSVEIRVPDGETIALSTLNPRLGVVGGISILGTQGTVRAYSHEAWRQAIVQGLSVAQALGCTHIALSSGRRSDTLLMDAYAWPEQCFIQAADFVGHAVREAAARHFGHIVWGGFFGKLVKIAQGHASTHARDTSIDFTVLADACARSGLDPGRAQAVKQANTAAQALEIIQEDAAADAVLTGQALLARDTLRAFACDAVLTPRITVHLFHLNGTELTRV